MDDTEFEHLVTRLRPALMMTAESIARSSRMNASDVDDAVQEALVRLWRAGNRLDDCHNVESFAIAIVRNVCIDFSRRTMPPVVQVDELQVATDSSADTSLMAESMRGMMESLIGRLPTTQQKLIRMRSEGMSLNEIAAIIQMPKTSVKTLIARARHELIDKCRHIY